MLDTNAELIVVNCYEIVQWMKNISEKLFIIDSIFSKWIIIFCRIF